ncbi:MAG: hypothetical protein ACLQIB_41575 [Isosphaeraceae bacterium]
MFINRFPAWFPAGRTLLTVVASALVGGSATLGIALWLRSHEGANLAQPGHDARFLALGRAYLPQLGAAYSRAWDQGATALDSGQTVSAALDLVAKNWTSNRTTLFDKLVAPELAKIVPESIKDSDVTHEERAALAAAWRGFAAGLGRPGPSSFVPGHLRRVQLSSSAVTPGLCRAPTSPVERPSQQLPALETREASKGQRTKDQ